MSDIQITKWLDPDEYTWHDGQRWTVYTIRICSGPAPKPKHRRR